MSVYVRIALYIFAGWLVNSGLIDEEVKSIITTDPFLVESIEAVLSALIVTATAVWWRLARRFGWSV